MEKVTKNFTLEEAQTELARTGEYIHDQIKSKSFVKALAWNYAMLQKKVGTYDIEAPEQTKTISLYPLFDDQQSVDAVFDEKWEANGGKGSAAQYLNIADKLGVI